VANDLCYAKKLSKHVPILRNEKHHHYHIILAIVVFLMICDVKYTEEPSRYYFKHSNELYYGDWVPKIFPENISNIYEQHNFDTNEVWLRFD